MQTACTGSFLVKSRCGLGEDNRSWDQDKGPLPVRRLDSRLHLEPYYPTNVGPRADAPMMGRHAQLHLPRQSPLLPLINYSWRGVGMSRHSEALLVRYAGACKGHLCESIDRGFLALRLRHGSTR